MIDPGWEALDAPAQGALAPLARRSANAERRANPLQLGPLSKVYLFWLAGLSCEGCTVAAVGATHPRIEQLLTG